MYATRAFSGEGGLKAPARWHHVGHPIVYTAQSLSLAALETWVHVSPDFPLSDHVQLWADIPEDLPVTQIAEHTLPVGWNRMGFGSLPLRDIGTQWLKSRESAVLQVPAATTPGEFNYLLNPLHAEFVRIRTGDPQPFTFDLRMWKK